MKKRDILLNPYVRLMSIWRRVASKPRAGSATLVLPPSAPGSLGDEALVAVTMAELGRQGTSRIGLIAYTRDTAWRHIGDSYEIVDLVDYFDKGPWQSEARFVTTMASYQRFMCIGADVMDGYYSDFRTLQRLRLVTLAAKTGADTSILGFSFNRQPTRAALRGLSCLPKSVRLCARDPVSQFRLQEGLGRSVDLVADLAFLLRSDNASKRVETVNYWIDNERAAGRIVLGINANCLHLRALETQDPGRLVQAYRHILCGVYRAQPKVSYLLLPHDGRSEHSDAVVGKSIWATLPVPMQAHTSMIPTSCSAAEVKAVCGNLDLVLSARMHVAIACLGQGTPVVCITYQGKFEGLFRLFDLDNMTLTPEVAFGTDEAAGFLLSHIERRAGLRAQILSKVPQIQDLARQNFLH